MIYDRIEYALLGLRDKISSAPTFALKISALKGAFHKAIHGSAIVSLPDFGKKKITECRCARCGATWVEHSSYGSYRGITKK